MKPMYQRTRCACGRYVRLTVDLVSASLDDDLFTGPIELAHAELQRAGLDPVVVGQRGAEYVRALLEAQQERDEAARNLRVANATIVSLRAEVEILTTIIDGGAQ